MIQRIYNKVSVVVIASLIIFMAYLRHVINKQVYYQVNEQTAKEMVSKFRTRIELNKNKVKVVFKDKVIVKYLPEEGGITYEEPYKGDPVLKIKTYGFISQPGFVVSFNPIGIGYLHKFVFFGHNGLAVGVSVYSLEDYKSITLGDVYGTIAYTRKISNTDFVLGYRFGTTDKLFIGLRWAI